MQLYDDLPQLQREIVGGLVRGADPKDLAWAAGRSPEEVLDLAHRALLSLDPALAEPVEETDRRRIGDYLLGRQSPGLAAGTLEFLDGSPDGRRWALWVRECLSPLYGDAPPPLPGDGEQAQAEPRGRRLGRRPGGRIRRRRAARARRRQQAAVQAAAAEMLSPYRSEALDALREGQDHVKLPHFASAPIRWTLGGLLVLLLGGVALAAFVAVPTHTAAAVIVAPIPTQAGGTGDLEMIVLESPTQTRVRAGEHLSVQLPDTRQRAQTTVRRVLPGVLSPTDIIERFQLPTPDANRVVGPAVVALAPLTTPPGALAPSRYAGAVSPTAFVRTGSRRVISMIVP